MTQSPINLRTPQAEPDPEQPFHDDLIQAELTARQLTSLVQHSPGGLHIGLLGRPGSGRTFLLKRWALTLRQKGFLAAFASPDLEHQDATPISSILGPIHHETLGARKYQECRSALNRAAAPRQRVIPLNNHAQDREQDEEIRQAIRDLGQQVQKETQHPLVVITDGLEHCSETLRKECRNLLDNILMQPGIVLLTPWSEKTPAAAPFTITMNIPPAPAQALIRTRMEEMGVTQAFQTVTPGPNRHHYQRTLHALTILHEGLGLTPRSIEQCLRYFALAVRSVPDPLELNTSPLAVLTLLRAQYPKLYQDLAAGHNPTLRAITRLDNDRKPASTPELPAPGWESVLADAEARLVQANQDGRDHQAARELAAIRNGESPENVAGEPPNISQHISRRLASLSQDAAQSLLARIDHEQTHTLPELTALLDLQEAPRNLVKPSAVSAAGNGADRNRS